MGYFLYFVYSLAGQIFPMSGFVPHILNKQETFSHIMTPSTPPLSLSFFWAMFSAMSWPLADLPAQRNWLYPCNPSLLPFLSFFVYSLTFSQLMRECANNPSNTSSQQLGTGCRLLVKYEMSWNCRAEFGLQPCVCVCTRPKGAHVWTQTIHWLLKPSKSTHKSLTLVQNTQTCVFVFSKESFLFLFFFHLLKTFAITLFHFIFKSAIKLTVFYWKLTSV